MKTKIKILLLTVVFPFYGFSQFQLGFTGGASYSAVKITEIDKAFTDVIQGKGITGYEIGLVSRLQWGGFYVKPKLLYSQSYGTVSYNVTSDNGETSENFSDININTVDVPLLFGLQLIGPTCIEAGPVYHYMTNATSSFNNNNLSYNRTSIGYRVGAGLTFDHIMFSAAYEGTTFRSRDAAHATFSVPYKLLFTTSILFGRASTKIVNSKSEE